MIVKVVKLMIKLSGSDVYNFGVVTLKSIIANYLINNMKNYDTVVEAINGLKGKGYILDLNISFDKLISTDKKISLNPQEFEIIEVHRFEGATNPSDEDVVYAVASKDGKIKGVLTSAFGLYAEPMDDSIVKKLTIHHK